MDNIFNSIYKNTNKNDKIRKIDFMNMFHKVIIKVNYDKKNIFQALIRLKT